MVADGGQPAAPHMTINNAPDEWTTGRPPSAVRDGPVNGVAG